MNKKGMGNIILMIIEILAVLIIVSALVNVAVKMSEGKTVVKTNTAKNLALMVNTLVGVPGDVVVEYPHLLSEYIILMKTNSLKIYHKDEKADQGTTIQFNLPKDYRAAGSVSKKKNVCLFKEGTTISLGECKNE